MARFGIHYWEQSAEHSDTHNIQGTQLFYALDYDDEISLHRGREDQNIQAA